MIKKILRKIYNLCKLPFRILRHFYRKVKISNKYKRIKRDSDNYISIQYKGAHCLVNKWVNLTKAQKKEIASYWLVKHPKKVDFYLHEIMLNIKGDYDVRYCPHNIFRMYLDDSEEYWPWIDKNYFDRHQPNIPFPETIIRNVNGCFLDHDYHLINKSEARNIILDNLPLLIKPSIDSGQGKNIKLISKKEEVEQIFIDYSKDYLLQKLIIQCDEFKKISPFSVASLRVITGIINGEVKLLKKHLLVNTSNAIAVNSGDDAGAGVVVIPLYDNGKLYDYAYKEDASKLNVLPSGESFGGIQIPNYDKLIKYCLDAHASMPFLDFVGFDVTVDENNEPCFIEWNQRKTDVYHIQLTGGPLFGEDTDYFINKLKIALKNRK